VLVDVNTKHREQGKLLTEWLQRAYLLLLDHQRADCVILRFDPGRGTAVIQNYLGLTSKVLQGVLKNQLK